MGANGSGCTSRVSSQYKHVLTSLALLSHKNTDKKFLHFNPSLEHLFGKDIQSVAWCDRSSIATCLKSSAIEFRRSSVHSKGSDLTMDNFKPALVILLLVFVAVPGSKGHVCMTERPQETTSGPSTTPGAVPRSPTTTTIEPRLKPRDGEPNACEFF